MKVKPQHATDCKSFECQLVKIACTENKTNDYDTMAIIYRPPTTGPDATFFDELSDLLDAVCDVIDRDRFVCCGDFNCGGDDDTSVCPELLTVLDAHGLQQLIQSPTRTTDKCRSLLDVVICSSRSTRVSQVAVHPSYQRSDHDQVTWSLSALVKPKPCTARTVHVPLS